MCLCTCVSIEGFLSFPTAPADAYVSESVTAGLQHLVPRRCNVAEGERATDEVQHPQTERERESKKGGCQPL